MTVTEQKIYWYILKHSHTLKNGVKWKVWQGEDRGDYVFMTKEPGATQSFAFGFHCPKKDFFKTVDSYLKDYRNNDYSKVKHRVSVAETNKKIESLQKNIDTLIKLAAGQWKV